MDNSVTLCLCRDASKFLSLFDGLAMLLHENLFASGVEPKVYVARNINPKLVGGEKLQSAMLYMLFSWVYLLYYSLHICLI